MQFHFYRTKLHSYLVGAMVQDFYDNQDWSREMSMKEKKKKKLHAIAIHHNMGTDHTYESERVGLDSAKPWYSFLLH